MQNDPQQPQIIYVPVYAQPSAYAPTFTPQFYPAPSPQPSASFSFPEPTHLQQFPVPETFETPQNFQPQVTVVYPSVVPSEPSCKEYAAPHCDEELQQVEFCEEHFSGDFSIKAWLTRGWRLYRQDWIAYSLFQAIILVGMFCVLLGQEYFLIIQSPLWLAFALASAFIWPLQFGFFIAGSHIVRQADGSRGLDVLHFLKAFHLYIPLVFVCLFVEIICSFGFLFFIIPGIYFGVTLSFAPYAYIEFHHDTNPLLSLGICGAIGHSHRVVKQYFWKVLGFLIVCGLINAAAFFIFSPLLVVTLPHALLSSVFVFRDLFHLHPDKIPDTHCYCC